MTRTAAEAPARPRVWLHRTGDWIFRWRSYLPLAILVFVIAEVGAAYAGGASRARPWELVVLAIGLSGLAIRLYVAGHVPHGTSGRNTRGQEAARLNTSGLYSVMRHPLYLGNFLVWMGLAVFPHRLWVAMAVAVAFWCIYTPVMAREDRWLRDTFGPEHERWAAMTPAMLPRLDLWRAPALPFCWRTAMRREHAGFFAFVAAVTALVIVADLASRHGLQVSWIWYSLFALSLLAYLVLRHLKRRTRVLDVAGR